MLALNLLPCPNLNLICGVCRNGNSQMMCKACNAATSKTASTKRSVARRIIKTSASLEESSAAPVPQQEPQQADCGRACSATSMHAEVRFCNLRMESLMVFLVHGACPEESVKLSILLLSLCSPVLFTQLSTPKQARHAEFAGDLRCSSNTCTAAAGTMF